MDDEFRDAIEVAVAALVAVIFATAFLWALHEAGHLPELPERWL